MELNNHNHNKFKEDHNNLTLNNPNKIIKETKDHIGTKIMAFIKNNNIKKIKNTIQKEKKEKKKKKKKNNHHKNNKIQLRRTQH